MGANLLVANIAYQEMNKNDLALYDAIVEGDARTIQYLIKRKYWQRIARSNVIKEPIRVGVMMETLEALLNTKRINVRMC